MPFSSRLKKTLESSVLYLMEGFKIKGIVEHSTKGLNPPPPLPKKK